ncbi:Protein FAM203A, partial [Stegodyphus mimosarum]
MATDSPDSDLFHIIKNISLNPKVRNAAWECILAMTATEDGLNYIIESETYIPFMLSFIQQHKILKELHGVYRCLVNISGTRTGCSTLLTLKKDFVDYLFYSITDVDDPLVELKCYILNNLTTHLDIYKDVSEIVPSEELLNTLMKYLCARDSNIKKKYEYLNFIFSNITRIPGGRRLFMKNDNYIHNLVENLKSYDSFNRCLGAALTLRNCCFDTDNHKRLLDDLNILPVLLYPLMGSEQYEENEVEQLPIECQYLDDHKKRIQFPEVRNALVQALSLLCNSEYGWNYLKSHGVYFVARELHLWEETDIVSEHIETLVSYMLVNEFSNP